MKQKILEHLVCPICQNSFILLDTKIEKNEVREGTLTCKNKHKFFITNFIPRLVPNVDSFQEQTKESFSDKWQRFEKENLEDKTVEFQFNWYLQRYGFKIDKELQKFVENKKNILEAGCGIGRAAEWFAARTKGDIFAIDISTSVDVARKRLSNIPNIHFIQADLTQLPFKKDFFDYISCDQVIHHTPNTKNSLKELVLKLKKGGEISFYTYSVKAPVREFCDDYIRAKTTKMSVEECLEFSREITNLGKYLSELNIELDLPDDIPLLGIKKGKQNLQRFFYWNIMKCFWNNDMSYDNNVSVNFDWYHPKYAHRHTPQELESWCKEFGLQIKNENIQESGISIRAQK